MDMSKIHGEDSAGCGAMGLRGILLAAAVIWLPAVALAQAAPVTAKSHPVHNSARTHATTQAAPAPMPQPETPPQPEAPKWPANEEPSLPSVTWDSQGLRIQASNASLSRILSEVSTQTGAKIEGLNGDERVFGDYGPGQARDVLAQLLHGSGYNFLMLGDQGQGAPREVILSAHGGSPAGQSNPGLNRSMPDQAGDEDSMPEQPEEDPTQVAPPPPPPEQMGPQGPLTPQQRMQIMQQQRLQQLQQLQQQQNQQPPPPPQ